VLRALKWLLLAVLLLALCLAGLLAFSAHSSLDRAYTYTARVNALPTYSAGSPDGIYRLPAGDFEFRLRVRGCEQRSPQPPVLLLHGFPVTSAMWDRLTGPLAGAGYCTYAPDLRGYSPGARPEGVQHYRADLLAGDVIAMADELRLDRFHLVGHDWGAVVGWAVVATHPERLVSWTGLSIAHPAAFDEALRTDPEQQASSSYFLLFSTPWLPEALFTANDLASLKLAYGGMQDFQVEEYLDLFAEPGALTAALNYYRAIAQSTEAQGDLGILVNTPTLFIWGNKDAAVAPRGVELQGQYMTGPYQEIELEAGHWLLVDQSEQVIPLVLSHLAAHGPASTGPGTPPAP